MRLEARERLRQQREQQAREEEEAREKRRAEEEERKRVQKIKSKRSLMVWVVFLTICGLSYGIALAAPSARKVVISWKSSSKRNSPPPS